MIVQELIRSRHATHKYRLAPQRRGIGTLNLSDVESVREMHRLWRECIDRSGRFSLLARDRKGRLSKCIAVIRVTKEGIAFRDNRCTLAVLLRNRSQREEWDEPI